MFVYDIRKKANGGAELDSTYHLFVLRKSMECEDFLLLYLTFLKINGERKQSRVVFLFFRWLMEGGIRLVFVHGSLQWGHRGRRPTGFILNFSKKFNGTWSYLAFLRKIKEDGAWLVYLALLTRLMKDETRLAFVFALLKKVNGP